jgi:hypothetical protein
LSYCLQSILLLFLHPVSLGHMFCTAFIQMRRDMRKHMRIDVAHMFYNYCCVHFLCVLLLENVQAAYLVWDLWFVVIIDDQIIIYSTLCMLYMCRYKNISSILLVHSESVSSGFGCSVRSFWIRWDTMNHPVQIWLSHFRKMKLVLFAKTLV